MRNIKIVKITLEGETDPREFTIKELTIEQIIELSQTSSLFGGNKEGENEKPAQDPATVMAMQNIPILGHLKDLGFELEKVMKSTCDFSLEDLKPLAPSEVKEVWNGFKEVNQDFLEVLEKLGLTKAFELMVEKVSNSFSAIAAIS